MSAAVHQRGLKRKALADDLLSTLIEMGLDWAWQGALFAVLTLVAAWLWWRWLNRQVNEQKPLDTHLNQRGQQIVGQRFTLETALVSAYVRGRSPARSQA